MSDDISPSPSGSDGISVAEGTDDVDPVSSINVFPPPTPLLLTPPPVLFFDDESADDVPPVALFDEVSLSSLSDDDADEVFELSDFNDVSDFDGVSFSDELPDDESVLLLEDEDVSECDPDDEDEEI